MTATSARVRARFIPTHGPWDIPATGRVTHLWAGSIRLSRGRGRKGGAGTMKRGDRERESIRFDLERVLVERGGEWDEPNSRS